jgi:hypothetical protein
MPCRTSGMARVWRRHYVELMDVESALSLISGAASAAVSGAATAAGQKAWQSLLTLAGRATGRADLADQRAVEEVDPTDAETVNVLTGRIAERARADAAFAEELCGWAEDHRAVIQVDRAEVHNTISGDARISGPVIQARDIQGGISL